jgi:hypothetical protein
MGFGTVFEIGAVIISGIVLADVIHDKCRKEKEQKAREPNGKTRKSPSKSRSRKLACQDLSRSDGESIKSPPLYSSDNKPPVTGISRPVSLLRSLNISAID